MRIEGRLISLMTVALLASAALAQADESASASSALMNKMCPMTGKPTDASKFVDYEDKNAGVYARLYFCCEKCQGKAAGMNMSALKPVYEKAYLGQTGGKKAAYGKTVLKVNNDKCPATGNPADGSMTMNYDGAMINLCCPDCIDPVASDPDKTLEAIHAAIEAAVNAAGQA